MKKTIALIVAVVFVFALSSLVIAAEEKKAVPAPDVKKAEEKKIADKTKQVTGEITKIDKEKKTIVVTKKVKDKATETVIAVDDKTKIMVGKDKKTFADLKVGDKAEVKFTEADGKNTAKSIAVKPAEKKAEPEKPVKKKKAMEGC